MASVLIAAAAPSLRCIADTAYDSDGIRRGPAERGTEPGIKPHPTRKPRRPYDRGADRARNAIGRLFGRLKDWRRVATRYDKLKLTDAATIQIAAAIMVWICVPILKVSASLSVRLGLACDVALRQGRALVWEAAPVGAARRKRTRWRIGAALACACRPPRQDCYRERPASLETVAMTLEPPDPLPPPPEGYDPATEEVMGPMSRGLGIRIVAWREGFGAVEMPVSPQLINRQGVVHGGAIATLIDTAAGYAVCFCPYPGRRRNAFTLSLTTNFISAGRRGLLRAEAWITGGGAAVKYVDAKAVDAEGRAIATATGVFRLRSDSRSLYGAPREAAPDL